MVCGVLCLVYVVCSLLSFVVVCYVLLVPFPPFICLVCLFGVFVCVCLCVLFAVLLLRGVLYSRFTVCCLAFVVSRLLFVV